MRKLYAVIDTLAQDITGTVITLRNDAEAIRFFTDILSSNDNNVARHPLDHQLVCMGEIINDNGDIYLADAHGTNTLVMTGEQWLATQQLQLQKKEA